MPPFFICGVETKPLHIEDDNDKPNPNAKNIAVVGGGVTGLATTFHLLRQLPSARITLFESSPRLGGWIKSEKVSVKGGHVIFENGPRTLRNDYLESRYTIDLVRLLGLEGELVQISKHSAAARNRYIYYPDHLVRLPGTLPGASTLMNLSINARAVWQEELFKNFLPGLFHFAFRSKDVLRPNDVFDESVASFVTRIMNRDVADNLVSAVAHGIYAGDIEKLSARSVFSNLWALEARNYGAGLARNMLDLALLGARYLPVYDLFLSHRTLKDVARGNASQSASPSEEISVFTFKDGLETLPKRLASEIKKSTRVELKTNYRIRSIARDPSDDSLIIDDRKGEKYDYLVSTISPASLAEPLKNGVALSRRYHDTIAALADHTYAVTVMVVNLYYSRSDLVPVSGFGYLIPQSIPYEQNPENALGVIFGSDSSVGQDTAAGTKLTVMIGGHMWDGRDLQNYPSEASAIEKAQSVLRRHLQISARPEVARAELQYQAIPQYTVGHHTRMEKIHELLLTQYAGRIKVAGNWFHGVGVNACTKAARKCVQDIRDNLNDATGLEHFNKPQDWALYKQREGTVAVDRYA
ncbi:MAG: hypothetical protein Q9227_002285 [Pyrenula ochraceoflavens]